MSARRLSGRVAASDRSAFPTVRGVPWWVALLFVLVAMVTGVAIDSAGGALEMGRGFIIGFFAGSVASTLMVARRSLFAVAVAPPILMTILVPLAHLIDTAGFSFEDLFQRSQVVTIALPLVSRFPVMAVTTVAVLAVVLVRAFLLEPRSRLSPRQARPERQARQAPPTRQQEARRPEPARRPKSHRRR